MCGHNGQLGVALELGPSLPSEAEVRRWYGEPVRAIVVPVSVFQTNKRGFPALSKAHQAVLVTFFQLNVQVSHMCIDPVMTPSLSHFDKLCLWVNAKSGCPCFEVINCGPGVFCYLLKHKQQQNSAQDAD